MQGNGRTIAVFGSSRCAEGSRAYREAGELGRLLARAGFSVMNGGYNGSMAAVSRGAHEAGGHVIGVTCALFDPLPANAWLSEEIKTPNLLGRLEALMAHADGFVAVRGGIGTLSEVTLAWSLLQTRTLRHCPLVLLGDDWQPILEALLAHSDLGPAIAVLARLAATPSAAVDALTAFFASPAGAVPPTPSSPPALG
jgi:uncharacterized protein (TIGR00730 family)